MDLDSAVEIIRPLVDRIRTGGAKAIQDIAKEIDGIDINPIKVSKEELKAALENLEPSLRASLEIAIERVRKVAQQSIPKDFSTELAAGATVSQRWHTN